MFVSFSSLHQDYLRYFRDFSSQLTSYSGNNFHVLVPMVYHEEVVNDEELRQMRNDFHNVGIPITNKPNILFFYLSKANEKYRPTFFAGFEVKEFIRLQNSLEDIIDTALENSPRKTIANSTANFQALVPKFSELLKAKNYIPNPIYPDIEVVRAIEDRLPKNKVFISHSSLDKPFVRELMKALAQENIDSWLDENEILVGDNIREKVTSAINDSQALIIVLSPSSAKSEWVKYEIAQYIAAKENRRIIPVLVGASVYDLPDPYKELQGLLYLDFSDEDCFDENIRRLSAALREIH